MGGGDGNRGSPEGKLKNADNYKFPKIYSTASTALSKRSFSTQDIGHMAALAGIDKLSHEDTVKNRMASHEKARRLSLKNKAVKVLNLSTGFNDRGRDYF